MSNNRVRVQLQQSTANIASETAGNITAEGTIKALHVIQARGKTHFNDPQWKASLDASFAKAIGWIKKTQSGGGYIGRGSGTAHSEKFLYDQKEYRIDIEIHGEKDPGWFK